MNDNEREYLIAKAQRVFYREATAEEKRQADKKNKKRTGALGPVAAAGGAVLGLRRGGPRRALRTGLAAGAVGGLTGAVMRRSYLKERNAHGTWTYAVPKTQTLAGAPDPDGEGFYGTPVRRVKRLPGE